MSQNAHKGNRLVTECLDLLKAMGISAWRVNVTRIRMKGRWVRFGTVGSCDISGILPNGKRLEIECKTGKGKSTPEQERYQKMIRDNGGAVCVVRDTPDGLWNWIQEKSK